MSHEIEANDLVLSTVSPEWHKLAKVVESIGDEEMKPLCFDIIERTPSFDLTITSENEVTMDDIKEMDSDEYDALSDEVRAKALLKSLGYHVSTPESHVEVPEYKMLFADIRHRTDLPKNSGFVPLHSPKASYQQISNREVYEMAKASFEGLGCQLVTAGTLGNLKKFFLSVDIGNAELKVKNGDKFENYLNFITSHDGTYALEVYDSSIRIVCMNTFRWSRETAGEIGMRFMHTSGVQKQMENLPAYLDAVVRNRRQMVESMDYLMTLECSPKDAAYVAAGYLANPSNATGNDMPRHLATKSYNRANDIRDLHIGGKGNQGKTRYDLFNGFTEYFTHHDGAGGKKADKVKKQTAARFGQAAEHKDAFLNLILDENRYQETLAYGEKVYKDRELDLAMA